MIAVTGAAGFIGSNLVWRLNRDGRDDVIAVDLDPNGDVTPNLAPLRFGDKVEITLGVEEGPKIPNGELAQARDSRAISPASRFDDERCNRIDAFDPAAECLRKRNGHCALSAAEIKHSQSSWCRCVTLKQSANDLWI